MRTRESLARRAGEARRARPGLVSVAVLTLGACGVGASDPPDPRARFVAEVWPALSNCRACHEKQPGMDFLAPGEPTLAYDTVFAYQPTIVDIETPASSLLLTMGRHTGPALTPYGAEAVRGWLEDERAARLGPDAEPIVAGPF